METGGIVSGEFGAYRTEFKILSGNFKQSNYGIVKNYSAKNSFLQAEEAKSGSGTSYGVAYTGTKGYCILSVIKSNNTIKLDGNISALENLYNGKYYESNGNLLSTPYSTPALNILYGGAYNATYAFPQIKFSSALGSNQTIADITLKSIVESEDSYGIVSVENLPIELTSGASSLHTEVDYRNMFLSDDNAFYAIGYPELGNTIISNFYAQHAEGGSIRAIGKYTHAEGRDTAADARYAHVEGSHSIAGGMASHAEGFRNIALGRYAHAEGFQTYSNANASHSEGNGTSALNAYSHAEGNKTKAVAQNAHTEGNGTFAQGEASHAEGYNTQALSSNGTEHATHAEGISTQAGYLAKPTAYSNSSVGTAAHAEGGGSAAIGRVSHAEGLRTFAIGIGSHAEGVGYRPTAINGVSISATNNSNKLLIGNLNENLLSDINIYDILLFGNQYGYVTSLNYVQNQLSTGTISSITINKSSSETINGTPAILYKSGFAYGQSSHSEGEYNRAIGSRSHAEGFQTSAIATRAHSEGSITIASNEDAHAEGNHTEASGKRSHSEGYYSHAVGDNSHAEGFIAWARGETSHASGQYSNAKNNNSFVWNGDTVNYTANTLYESNDNGSFNVNPENGINGFFIGTENLSAIIKGVVENVLREHNLIQ